MSLLSLARAALACACILPLAAPAAEPAALRALADRTIRPLMAQYGVPGMAVGITAGGRTMFFNYGMASTQDGAPVTKHTLFELGSISKTFAATLALYGQAQGKLSLDDHPGDYLPALKGSPIDKASLRHLGTYTAGGLPLQFPDEVEGMAATMAYYGAWRPDAAPGTLRRYSNPSIGLLGQATAAALGQGFGEALEGQLLPALGLRDTYAMVPPAAMGRYAWGVDAAGKPARATRAALDVQTYGIKSSAADMIRYLQANMEPSRLVGPARLAVEGTHVGYYRVGEMVQGLGWEQYRPPLSLARLLAGNAAGMIHAPNPATPVAPQAAPPGTLFNKTGSTRGFGAYALFVPDRKIGIVLLANKNFPIPARIEAAHALMEALDPRGGR
ncbi:class C beta-lactamase [Massilia sp. ST3]|uniref:class C beta-lactamase n=1 Tax=Massilia sp. ST3 TaxID=2824903 RepID=UPI001B831E25|nr:beta-lactamase [Massilia sp. ST3]